MRLLCFVGQLAVLADLKASRIGAGALDSFRNFGASRTGRDTLRTGSDKRAGLKTDLSNLRNRSVGLSRQDR
jgi:hypothetical protein